MIKLNPEFIYKSPEEMAYEKIEERRREISQQQIEILTAIGWLDKQIAREFIEENKEKFRAERRKLEEKLKILNEEDKKLLLALQKVMEVL